MDLSEYPDYDFTFLDGTTANDLTALGRGLEAAASDLQKTAAGLATCNKTTEVDKVHGDLVVIRQQLESQATAAVAAGAAVSAMKRAADAWKKAAPTRAELEAADTAVKQASSELSTTANSGASGAEVGRLAALLQQARDHFRDLRSARDSADKALVEALDRIAKSLGGTVHKKDEKRAGDPSGRNLPGSKPNPSTPAPSAAPAPSPAARSAAALPGTAPVPTPAPYASPATSPSSANEAAIAALMADQRRAGQPVQIPQAQPQQAPAAPAPTVAPPPPPQRGGGSNPKQDKSEAVTSEDLDRAIGSAPAAVPVLGPAAGITPTSPASPAATAAAAPATTGTSVTGLHTDAPVSGRTDGPRTALAAGTPENATRVAPQANPAGTHPAGAPMGGGMPMAPGMGGGGGAPSRKQNTPVARYTPETAEAHGHTTINEAVRGGTIAQNLPDRAE